ncbi:MAG: hypothetical protein BWY71_01698 [Planctomycetes bacterium ADurb.Bin412]|nr:MAG: hypothetical protein BWY71_01698 [Planctomycetes bacterium ADurb.Bin412]
MILIGFPAVYEPFVHPPEMGVLQVQAQFVHQPGHQGQLLGRPDRPADPHRVIRGGLLPGGDVFEGFRQVEILQGVVEPDLEAFACEGQHIFWGEPGGVV